MFFYEFFFSEHVSRGEMKDIFFLEYIFEGAGGEEGFV